MSGNITILCVDDDDGIQTVVKTYFESNGNKVLSAFSAKELDGWLDTHKDGIDVVLLDLVLKDAEGLALISKIRAVTDTPIIIVSGKTDTTEKIVCLELGADDYITKPFELRELSARIKAVLRRSDALPGLSSLRPNANDERANDEADEIIHFGDWYIHRGQYQLFSSAHESADLTTGEFKLLETLVLSNKRAVSRERLFEITRDNTNYDSYDRAIDIQIARLRKKLGDNPKKAEIIKTVRGIGYMFCADIRKSS